MTVRSLVEMAQRVAIEHVDLVTDVGYLPFHTVRPILEKINNPDQLKQIEEVRPDLRGNTSYLWQRFIYRDYWYAAKKMKYKVDHPAETSELYYRYQDEDKKQMESALSQFISKTNSLKAEKSAKILTLAPANAMPKAPESGNSRFGSSTLCASSSYRDRARSKGQMDFEKKMKKFWEAQQQQVVLNRASVLARNTRQINKAPKGMVKRADIESRAQPARFVTRSDNISVVHDENLASREERLRRAKEGKILKPSPSASDRKAPAMTRRVSHILPPAVPQPQIRRTGILKFGRNSNDAGNISIVPAKRPVDDTEVQMSDTRTSRLLEQRPRPVGAPSETE